MQTVAYNIALRYLVVWISKPDESPYALSGWAINSVTTMIGSARL
jgi:hypothetical protein